MGENIFDLIGSIIGGCFIGAFCGALPLVFGIIKKRVVLGVCGIVSCVILGAVFTTLLQLPAFLALIVAVAWTLAIFLTGKNKNEKK